MRVEDYEYEHGERNYRAADESRVLGDPRQHGVAAVSVRLRLPRLLRLSVEHRRVIWVAAELDVGARRDQVAIVARRTIAAEHPSDDDEEEKEDE